jgi:phosphonopyruvate decarboxylase
VLDGDGAALMKLGTLSTVGHYRPKGLLHVVIDNEAHESTGGQATASPTTDFAAVAVGCGYRRAWRVDGVKDLAGTVAEALGSDGPALIHVKVALGSTTDLGRPSLRPDEVKEQFMAWLASTAG